jgi:Mg2+ and Co2+ transporter CorA
VRSATSPEPGQTQHKVTKGRVAAPPADLLPRLVKADMSGRMLTFHPLTGAATDGSDLTACEAMTRSAIWLDMVNPSQEEEHAVEAALGIDVPTKDEMQDIATSSRLYQEGEATFMTATPTPATRRPPRSPSY